MEKRTKICCFNVDENIKKFISDTFEIYDASLGNTVNVCDHNNVRGSTFLLLNNNLPSNMQEYDIFIFELDDNKFVPYIEEEHIRKEVYNENITFFISRKPSTLFNPKPFSQKIFAEKIVKQNRKRPIIKIIFQTQKRTIKYNIKDYKAYDEEHVEFTTYECTNDFTHKPLTGTEVDVCENNIAHTIFDKFVDKIKYLQTFYHPQIFEWDRSIGNPNFIPLLVNKVGEIVSYLWMSEQEITFMLPQTEEKVEMLKILFNEILYKDFSEYFPYINLNSWKKNNEYLLPNVKELNTKKEIIKKEYEKKLEEVENEINSNNKKYSFLHDLLTETGDNLVSATIKYLKWLGFNKVLDKDETIENGVFEEDIQIDLDERGIIIIEVKGLFGTSKDYECSQISKIRRRREKERNKWDVSALYLVNNQRNIEPLKRILPPFNDNQIQDAINDERALAYTWQLFTLYYNIENGIMSKEEARERFLNKGLLNFDPNLIKIGEPYHYYQNDSVACIELNNCEINIHDDIYYETNGIFHHVTVEELQVDKVAVEKISEGKIGIKLSEAIPRGKTLYKKIKI